MDNRRATIVSRWVGWIAGWMVAVLVSGQDARADILEDCTGEDMLKRLTACTALIDRGGLNDSERAVAYSARALAYSVRGEYGQAIADYDVSLGLDPESAIALNNRAWAYVKSGSPERGVTDVEKALALQPDSPHTLDTRAHIFQSRGDQRRALNDYESAIQFGGEHIIKLYQCGLQAQSFYTGEIDGLFTSDMRKALEACVGTTGCDPLPADEECRKTTS